MPRLELGVEEQRRFRATESNFNFQSVVLMYSANNLTNYAFCRRTLKLKCFAAEKRSKPKVLPTAKIKIVETEMENAKKNAKFSGSLFRYQALMKKRLTQTKFEKQHFFDGFFFSTIRKRRRVNRDSHCAEVRYKNLMSSDQARN